MFTFHPKLLPAVAAALLVTAGAATAFSFGDSNFSFGDDDYWGGPYWNPYGVPRLPSYDRAKLRMQRQQMMRDHVEALNDLGDMLYSRYSNYFDRDKAIDLARRIQSGAGPILMGSFHPGAIATDGSRTTPAFWGNEDAFKANADALQATAGALVDELQKVPGKGEKAIYLSRGPFGDNAGKTEAVSPAVWDRFQDVANTCRGCHAGFRGPRW